MDVPSSPADKAFFDSIVAAGPDGLAVKAGRLVARSDGDFDLILADPVDDACFYCSGSRPHNGRGGHLFIARKAVA